MGSLRMDLSTKFGKEIPSRDLREKRSVEGDLCTITSGDFSLYKHERHLIRLTF